jgi:lipopolysaccharide/colanic/teichoic acid biosynthesis glycosyltransferase
MLIKVWTVEKWKEVERVYLKERKGIRMHLVFKRLLDIALASFGILISLPVLALIAIAVRLSSPGSILFRQERLGKFGTTFTIYKFRTMVDGAINIGTGLNTFKGDPRVTRIGKFLREYHLDELPQLFNVLKGDMSLVGPRPLLPLELPKYSDRQKRRLLVSPGITAWEAVNGGLDNTREERIELDLWYVERWNFWLDLLILARTVPVVLRKEGAYAKAPSSQASD